MDNEQNQNKNSRIIDVDLQNEMRKSFLDYSMSVIAMGFGSEAAIEASDAVLASGTLKQLPKAIKIARSVINTVKGNIIFALSIKALVIILAAFGLAQIWMSVIADTGVSVVCVLIAARLLKKKY